MARIRSVRPEFRTDLTAAAWPRDVRLFFTYLKCYVDDFGKGVDEPRLIKADCFPVDDDVTALVVDEWLDVIARDGAIVRYQVAGRRYLVIPGEWWDQKPQHPSKSQIPDPKDDPHGHSQGPPEDPHEAYGNPHEDDRKPHPNKGRVEEGRGGERARETQTEPSPERGHNQEPPLGCPIHPAGTDTPCRACADARRELDRWLRRQRDRPTPTPDPPHCPIHPEHPTGSKACPECARADRKADTEVLDTLRRSARKDPARC